jgi:hypothetical protein
MKLFWEFISFFFFNCVMNAGKVLLCDKYVILEIACYRYVIYTLKVYVMKYVILMLKMDFIDM